MSREIKYEIKIILLTFLNFIIFRPLTFVAQIFPEQTKNKFNDRLIRLINKMFGFQKKLMVETQTIKYDIRKYRDTYDRVGMDLYTRNVDPEILFKDKLVLDLGCGVGGKDLEMLKFDPKLVYGIDLSDRNIGYAKEIINNTNENNLKFEHIDLFDLDQNSMQFDTIVSYTVFEHIDKHLLLPILNKSYELLNSGGYMLIVFNHYNDKFGSHLKEYVHFPWPQIIFEEDQLFRFWNKSLLTDPNITEDSYFPKSYVHGIGSHNEDCFMNLNKVSIEEFKDIILQTKFMLEKVDLYSEFELLKKYKILPKKYLRGSAVYVLKK